MSVKYCEMCLVTKVEIFLKWTYNQNWLSIIIDDTSDETDTFSLERMLSSISNKCDERIVVHSWDVYEIYKIS